MKDGILCRLFFNFFRIFKYDHAPVFVPQYELRKLYGHLL